MRAQLLVGSNDQSPPLALVAAASSTTGALAWGAAYPFDVVKSVQQAQPLVSPSPLRSIGGAALSLWRRGGHLAFYSGLGAGTARAMIVTSSRLVTYETVKARM